MVDEGSCTWVDVPGTNPVVRLQIQNGQPLPILRAFVADINAYVEPVRDADTACWTAGNSVSTSNHLSGTAVDINWDSHPFRVADAGWSQDEINTIRQILDFYEGTVFWGNDWTDPKDAMHFQLASLANGGDIDTFNNPHTQDFIDRQIRADGFSTFRRGGAPVPPPASKADGYALAIIGEGRRRDVTPRGIQIALSVALVESNLTMYANSNVPESLNIPHDKVGSDHDSVGLFQQRCPMWGPAEVLMDPAQSAGLFYDRLVKLDYNNTGRLPGDYAADVQRPAAQYRGRYQERMGDAVALYDRLATNVPPPQGDDFMSALSDAEQREVLDLLRWLAAPGTGELRKLFPSRSGVREPGEGLIDTLAGLISNVDGNVDFLATDRRAQLRYPPARQRLQRVAAGGEPGRNPDDALLAQAILADVTSKATATTAAPVAAAAVPVDQTPELTALYAENARLREENTRLQATATPAPVVAAPVPAVTEQAAMTSGDHAGKVIDSVEDWTQHILAMDTPQRAAFITSMKALELPSSNGTQS
jgi:hypothetical protein